MSSEPYSPDTASSDAAWLEIETLLDELAQVARSEVTPRQFYSDLLSASVRALAAVAGAVWTKSSTGLWQVEYQLHLEELELETSEVNRSAHLRLLLAVAQGGTGVLVPPQFDAIDSSTPSEANPSPYLLVLAPVISDGETIAIVEIVQRAGGTPSAQRGYLRLLSALADIALDFHRAEQLRELASAQGEWRQLAQFAQRIHASLDRQQTSYTLANEARRLVGCDRVCVLVHDRRFKLQAVSGTETFDPRANFVRRVEAVAQAAMATGEELWIEDDLKALAPELEDPLQAYLDECHTRSVAILPLWHVDAGSGGKDILGALVFEQFHNRLDAAMRRRAESVCLHGATALSNVLEVERLPFARSLRRVAKARTWLGLRYLPRTLLFAGALLGILTVLTLWPAELRISARGELQPALQREVFAPLDGIVDQLNVRHGQHVTAGEVLAQLRSPDLELHQRRVEGERQTAQKRLEALAAARVGKRFTTDDELQEYRRLTAEEEEVKAELAGLAAQQKILNQQVAELTVKSPITGEVLTWDVADLLTARPVTRGQVLLSVAEVDGPWVLEVQLPDQQSGHVLTRYREAQGAGEPVSVEYMLATRPGEKLRGHIQSIAEATEADRENRASVQVTIALDIAHLPALRPGATAVAKIDCGEHALGYVWLHDLIDTVRTWLFF